jgi:phospholipid/cholesterol/gamma-HCH transport system substrate-binding protein
MENRAHALAAGLFTLLLGAATLLAAMWLSGDTYETVSYTLESRHTVSGLNLQAPVRLRGVEVGKVNSIAFDPADSRLILVGISVRSGTPITRGTTAQLGSQGVTGLAYVMLEDDGARPEPLPAGDDGQRIPLRPSFLDELSGSGKDLVAEVNVVARRLNALLDDKNQAQLMRTLANLDAATARIAALAQALEPGAKAVPALAGDARKALAHADELFAEMTELARTVKKEAAVLERVARGAEQVGGSAQSMSSALTAESLPRINALLDEIARNSRSLERLLGELNDQPASLVFGRPPPPPGPGEPGFQPPRGSTP